jgi:hypothetical protein
VAGEDRSGVQGQVVGEGRAGGVEQLLEHPAHGEDGGAGVHARAGADRDFPHLAAGRRRALQHHDFEAAGGQVQRGGEAAYPGADDGDAPRGLSHAPVP